MSEENFTAGGTGGEFPNPWNVQRLTPEMISAGGDRPDVTVFAQGYGIAYRKYLPTLADLLDRLSIVQLKEINIVDKRKEYREESALLKHDIDLLSSRLRPPTAKEYHAMQVLAIANAWIWQNESKIRDGSSAEPDDVVLSRLKLTHAINGVRNTAKNIIAAWEGGRQDYKIDCFAAELPAEFGNWDIFS